jgi:hypothetical protein
MLVLVMGGIIPEKSPTNLFRAVWKAHFFRSFEVKRVTSNGAQLLCRLMEFAY